MIQMLSGAAACQAQRGVLELQRGTALLPLSLVARKTMTATDECHERCTLYNKAALERASMGEGRENGMGTRFA